MTRQKVLHLRVCWENRNCYLQESFEIFSVVTKNLKKALKSADRFTKNDNVFDVRVEISNGKLFDFKNTHLHFMDFQLE